MSDNTIRKQLAALPKMSPAELRERYADLYGERSRSGNKQWLIRRCAWRIQSLAEGGLSERAKRRAKELARDQDIRVIPPEGLAMDPLDHEPDVVALARKHIRRTPGSRDDRVPAPGTRLGAYVGGWGSRCRRCGRRVAARRFRRWRN